MMKVKKLQWEKSETKDALTYTATTPVAIYQAYRMPSGRWFFTVQDINLHRKAYGHINTLSGIKTFAQDDFHARIQDCIETPCLTRADTCI